MKTLGKVNRTRYTPDSLAGNKRVQLITICKDVYASVRLHRDMVANVDSSDYICRHVDVDVRLSLEI